jgi:imidazolonepropionase-like amidohydrolase
MNSPPYHLTATLLPFGTSPIDLWVVDGRITLSPQVGARDLAAPGGYVTAGLVDAHTHLHFVREPHARRGRSVVDDNRRRHLHAGTLLIRDLGATSDDVLNLPDDDGLPIVQAAGQSLLVEGHYPFFVTAAKELPGAAAAQAKAGARWIKIFVDWPGWLGGDEEPEFGDDNRLTYPTETLAETVHAAHAAGARVAIHAFGREGAAAGVAAGVDSIEHGWGLEEAQLKEMAEKRIGWTPMLVIADPMLKGAEGGTPRPTQARWIRESLDRLKTLIPLGHRLGVTILAGTDWFPSVTIAEEVILLHRFGLSADAAIGAATSAARAFLGAPDVEEGAPADLVLFREDPREELSRLARPELIMLRGELVRRSAA